MGFRRYWWYKWWNCIQLIDCSFPFLVHTPRKTGFDFIKQFRIHHSSFPHNGAVAIPQINTHLMTGPVPIRLNSASAKCCLRVNMLSFSRALCFCLKFRKRRMCWWSRWWNCILRIHILQDLISQPFFLDSKETSTTLLQQAFMDTFHCFSPFLFMSCLTSGMFHQSFLQGLQVLNLIHMWIQNSRHKRTTTRSLISWTTDRICTIIQEHMKTKTAVGARHGRMKQTWCIYI